MVSALPHPVRRARAIAGLLATVLTISLMAPAADAALLLNDELRPVPDADYRPGQLLPGAEQLALVHRLGATASWNRYGTVHNLVRHGGYLAQGLDGAPVEAARDFIKANRALFKLSETGVDELELLNEGITPYNPARAVLFRQRFGGLSPTTDGLITVGVVDGKVYYVSSSSAGDQPPPAAASLSPQQAWLLAAQDVGRPVSASRIKAVLDRDDDLGWTLIDVDGYSQPQRARLTAVPIPSGGVRQAYETVLVDVQGALAIAYVHFIDAQTGAVLKRENRLNWQSTDTTATPFQGAFTDSASCGPRHDIEVAAGHGQLTIAAASVQPANDIVINLYSGGQLIASNDLLTSPETLIYTPTGGVAAGTYQVEICPFEGSSLPPLDYAGALIAGDAVAVATLPSWKWFPASPDPISYGDEDLRKLGCWVGAAGCDFVLNNVAARYPWDVLPTVGNVPTMTTIGNAAITAESWLSPLTPAENYRPVSPSRQYDFPFANVWHGSGCDSSNLVPGGNDIDASVTNLFVVHNRMHDWAYFLGFTELNYNLQLSNFGITDATRENDPEIGNVQAGAITGHPASPTFYTAPGRDNANQITLQDGVPGITNQYLFQSLGGVFYTPCVDASFDMSVVGHEYTHAISNRMVGGPDSSIGGHQGRSMGESWSDLDASEYLLANNFLPVSSENPTAVGAYATGDPELGIRDYALDNNPLNYSNIGFDTPGPEVHSDGEVWNAVQWSLRQALIDKYEAEYPYRDTAHQLDCANGKYAPENCPGNRRWIQLMFDSFLLMPAAPSMLDARDATLAADLARFGGANQKELWRIFASRGMGINAYSNGSDDTAPVANFESPLEPAARVSFQVLAADGSKAAITSAKIYIGDYSVRSRPIADTDPATVVDGTDEATLRATANTRDYALLLPGQYDFIVAAPGHGIHHFRAQPITGDSSLSFSLPSNWASISQGATVSTSATLEENIAAKDGLIDDDENTGARFGDEGLVEGAYAIIQLAGGAHPISRLQLSTAGGPGNPGRFTGVRKFELRVCNGTCADPVNDFNTIAYTSPDDAFPGKPLRPLQPNLILRSFEFPAVSASHVMLRALSNQCTGQPLFAGDQDNDPLVNADCPSYVPPVYSFLSLGWVLEPSVPNLQPVAPASVVRATDIQVFSAAASLATSGGGSSGSSGGGSGGDDGSGRLGGGGLPPTLLLALAGLGLLRRRRPR